MNQKIDKKYFVLEKKKLKTKQNSKKREKFQFFFKLYK